MIFLPRKIYLTAINKHWKVSYIHSSEKLTLIESPHHKLTLYGKNYSKRAALKLITKWIKLKAQDYLSLELIKINRRIKANYKKVIVRSNESQWGSCSNNKTISLDCKLIFLPKPLVRYLIIHELCHLRHLNHSKRFWDEVEKFDKKWSENKKAMKTALEYIPEWAIF